MAEKQVISARITGYSIDDHVTEAPLDPASAKALVLPVINCSWKQGPEEAASCQTATDLIEQVFTKLGFSVVRADRSNHPSASGCKIDVVEQDSREQDSLTELAEDYGARIVVSCVLLVYQSIAEKTFFGVRKASEVKVELKILDAEGSEYLALGVFKNSAHGLPMNPLFGVLPMAAFYNLAQSKDLRSQALADAIAYALNDFAQQYSKKPIESK